jgi:hypothetical protein
VSKFTVLAIIGVTSYQQRKGATPRQCQPWAHRPARPEDVHDVAWDAEVLAEVNFRVRLYNNMLGNQPQEVGPWGQIQWHTCYTSQLPGGCACIVACWGANRRKLAAQGDTHGHSSHTVLWATDNLHFEHITTCQFCWWSRQGHQA